MIKKRVIIVDDEIDVLDGLHAWLRPTYDVSSFNGADSFLAATSAICRDCATPTCLLLDFQMPDINGVDLQRRIRLMNMNHPVIFMSGAAQQSDIIDAWRGGAVDFVLKPFSAHEIDNALAKSFAQLPGHLARSSPMQTCEPRETLPITRREAQVLRLLGRGLQQQEVAEKLGLSLRTVKMYRALLKEKINLNTLA